MSDKLEIVSGLTVQEWCDYWKEGNKQHLKDEVDIAGMLIDLRCAAKFITAREEKMAELQAERDRLRAYAECMKCWRDYCHQVNEDKSDWSKTLRGHGWNPSENGPIEFMDSLLTTALSAKGEAVNE